MRRWVQTAVVLAWAGSIPTGLPLTHASQLPEDVHPDSRSRLPPIDREELDVQRRATYDAAVQVEGPAGAPMGGAALRLHGSGTNLRWAAPMGRQLTELTILTAAREYDQPFEWGLHELEALAVWLDAGIIDIVRHRRTLTGLGEREAIIIGGRPGAVRHAPTRCRHLRAGTGPAGEDDARRCHRRDGPLCEYRGDAHRVQSADAGWLEAVAAATVYPSGRYLSRFAEPSAPAKSGEPDVGVRALRPHVVSLGDRSGTCPELRSRTAVAGSEGWTTADTAGDSGDGESARLTVRLDRQ